MTCQPSHHHRPEGFPRSRQAWLHSCQHYQQSGTSHALRISHWLTLTGLTVTTAHRQPWPQPPATDPCHHRSGSPGTIPTSLPRGPPLSRGGDLHTTTSRGPSPNSIWQAAQCSRALHLVSHSTSHTRRVASMQPVHTRQSVSQALRGNTPTSLLPRHTIHHSPGGTGSGTAYKRGGWSAGAAAQRCLARPAPSKASLDNTTRPALPPTNQAMPAGGRHTTSAA